MIISTEPKFLNMHKYGINSDKKWTTNMNDHTLSVCFNLAEWVWLLA